MPSSPRSVQSRLTAVHEYEFFVGRGSPADERPVHDTALGHLVNRSIAVSMRNIEHQRLGAAAQCCRRFTRVGNDARSTFTTMTDDAREY